MSTNPGLIPLNQRSKEAAKEIQTKGGYAKKGFILAPTRNCNHNCPLWNRCWAASASTQYAGKCALARAPELVSKRTVKTIMGGETEWAELMMDLVAEIEAQVRKAPNAKTLMELNKEYRETYALLYGTKQRMKAVLEDHRQGGVLDVESEVRKVLEAEVVPKKEEVKATMEDVARLVDQEPKTN